VKRFLHLIRYIRLLKKNKKALADSRINNNPNPLGIQYDWIFRLYTVLNIPFDEKNNINKYGIYYIDEMVKEHIAFMNNFLFGLGILGYVELDTENIIRIDEFNVRIVLKFKYLNIKNLFRFSIIFIIVLLILIILLLTGVFI
jgi:hypothetical protein